MTRRRRKPNGFAYVIAKDALQQTAGLLVDRHRPEQCAWCRRVASGTERTPCPENPQMELFA